MNVILSITSLASLTALGLNILFLKSQVLGLIIAPIYLFTASLFCGSVFFSKETVRFRVFYGFIVFFCLLVILGTIAYWIQYLSNLLILAILLILTILLILLNLKQCILPPLAGIKLKEKITKLNLGILDLFFLALVGLSFYFPFTARTGESIPPPLSLLPGWFFICLISAIAILLMKVWHGKSPSGLLLFYAFLVILIPAIGFLVLMHQPYATVKAAMGLEADRMVAEFGRFVSDSAHPEAARSIIGRAILTVGQHIGDVFLIKLLQAPPQRFALWFVPILFTLMAVFAPFDLLTTLAPERKKLALLGSLSFLATQHNVFLFTPPGKDETFALGLLMVSLVIWLRFAMSERFRFVPFIVLVVLLGAISLIHQFVGLFALYLSAMALSLFLLKPFKRNLSRLCLWIGVNFGFLFGLTYGLPYLHSLVSYLTGVSIQSATVIGRFNLSQFVDTIAPSLWSKEGLGLVQAIFYTFLNNSVYVTYALIMIGIIGAVRYRLDKDWLAMTLSGTVLAFLYFGIVGNFFVQASEAYRFFYYLSFLVFPLIGIGLYWLTSRFVESRIWLYTRSEKKETFVSLQPLQLGMYGLLLAVLFTSSIWAGYPREDSMGPYRQKQNYLWYPSDHDVAALHFIKALENENGDFFIVGDAATTAAGIVNMGYQVISTDKGYIPIFSFFGSYWGSETLFNLAASEPIKYLVEGTDSVHRLAGKAYIVLSYRLGRDRLRSLFQVYSGYLGKPVYSVEDKLYVFVHDREQVAALLAGASEEQLVLFDDESVEDKFWELQLIGTGNLDFAISDDAEVKTQGRRSLKVAISPGKYERASLRHALAKPVDLSEEKYLLLYVYGTDSGQSLNIVFRGERPLLDFFQYRVRDNFRGWKLLIIPLASFQVGGGSPSWQVINEMLIQFRGTWSSGEIYFDRISLAKELSLKLLYEEPVINLP